MEKIVVPIDFSDTSLNAYHYAIALGKLLNKAVQAVHVNFGSFTTKSIPTLQFNQSTSEVLLEQLKLFLKLDEKNSNADLDVEPKIIQGQVVRSLVEISKDESTYMLVMGSTGASDLAGKLFGSVSSTVAQKAHCPVLLVPKGKSFSSYHNILYASNEESDDEQMVKRIKSFNADFGAALHFIHIMNNEDEDAFKESEEKIFDALFKDGDPLFSFHISNIKSRFIVDGLLKYTLDYKIDLMVLINRQRTFFESFIGQSMTKKIALQSKVPILIYHL